MATDDIRQLDRSSSKRAFSPAVGRAFREDDDGGRIAYVYSRFTAPRSSQAASTSLFLRSSAADRGCSKSSSIAGRAKRSRTAVASRSPIWCFRRAMRTASRYPRGEVGPSREHIVALPLERSRPRLLEIVVDRGSVEAFANGGRVALTDLVFPPRDADRVAVFAQQRRATLSGLTATQLRAGDDTTDDSTPR
jgi:hypothetical protein